MSSHDFDSDNVAQVLQMFVFYLRACIFLVERNRLTLMGPCKLRWSGQVEAYMKQHYLKEFFSTLIQDLMYVHSLSIEQLGSSVWLVKRKKLCQRAVNHHWEWSSILVTVMFWTSVTVDSMSMSNMRRF
eukprot:2199801-Rhodomonas_salina.1